MTVPHASVEELTLKACPTFGGHSRAIGQTPTRPRDRIQQNPHLEGELKVPAVEGKIAVLRALVQLYLNDLNGSLGRDTERARSLLAELIGHVTLRRDGQRLVAELQGNLSGLPELDDQPLYKGGSGGTIFQLPSRQELFA